MTHIHFCSDSRHLIRLSVRELEESQKMQILVRIRTKDLQLTDLNASSISLLLESASIAVYEIKPTALGAINPTYRTLLVHQILGFDFVNSELPIKIFVPHFEMEYFSKREFMIEFNEKIFIKLSG